MNLTQLAERIKSPTSQMVIDYGVLPTLLVVSTIGLISAFYKPSPVPLHPMHPLCSIGMFPSDAPLERPFSNTMWYGFWIEEDHINPFEPKPEPKPPAKKLPKVKQR